MVESAPPKSSSATRGRGRRARRPVRFESAKRQLLVACVAVAAGLAVSGSLDRTTGGLLVVVGWGLAVVGLHRFGRAGADRGAGRAPRP